jgi:hypothetical protein
LIGLYGLDEHGPVLVPVEVEYEVRHWLRTRSCPEPKEDCLMRRVTALQPPDLQAADWIQKKPKLRYVTTSLFTSLTYVLLPNDKILTIPANSYLVNDGGNYSVVAQADFDTQWEDGP